MITLFSFGLPVGTSLRLLLEGGAGDKYGIARSLIVATPLLICGLGMTIAWRAGMYNIGGEGQYILGGLCGATIAKLFHGIAPMALNWTILLASIIGGAAYALLAGWLYVRRGVQVVISTILLNFIALQALGWAVNGPLKERRGRLPQTDSLPNEAMLYRFDAQTDLHSGVFFGLAVCVIAFVFLFWTKSGFKLRVVGQSPRVARANRIDAGRVQMLAMAISGALCGLAAGVQYTGIQRELSESFSENWGFIAIPVALLGGLHPLGVLASSLYFGLLFAGAKNLERFTPNSSAMVYVIQALAVLALVAVQTAALRKQIREQEAT